MVDEQFVQMQAQMDRRFKGVHDSIEENTELTKAADARSARIEADTKVLVEIFSGTRRSANFFVNMARLLRKVAIFLSPFLALLGIIGALMHGKWPTLD